MPLFPELTNLLFSGDSMSSFSSDGDEEDVVVEIFPFTQDEPLLGEHGV